MQEDHPGTVISIKTHHTLNLLYNTAKQGITQIRSRGVLDNDDCNLLEQLLKNMHVYLHIPSTMPPASPIIAIHNLAWLFSNEQLTIQQKYEIEEKILQALPNENIKRFENESLLHPQTVSWQDFLWHKNDKIHGIYLLVNGIIEEWKLDPYDIDAYHYEIRSKEINRTRQTITTTTQQILSPNHLKHVHYSSEYQQSISKNQKDLQYSLVNENIEQSNINEIFSDALSQIESTTSRETDSLLKDQSINTFEKDTKFINMDNMLYNKTSHYDYLKSTTGVRVAFEDGIQLALRILPDIQAFQYSSIKSNNNRSIVDFTLIDKRLLNSGLLIYNEMTCTSDDIIHINEDLLLIAGSVRNQISKYVYEAPIFIKRSLSKQGLKLLEGRSITKILVLPKVITTINMNNIFTDNSLIHHILDIEMKRNFSQRSTDKNYKTI
ncbi:unnamed protein product [Rotaria sp. Silwood1]|nr:unnamed protein product [Rotaria sp. Silwood1]